MKKVGERAEESGLYIIVEMSNYEYDTFWKLKQSCDGKYNIRDFMLEFGGGKVDRDLADTFIAIRAFIETQMCVNALDSMVGELRRLLSNNPDR